MDYLVDVNASVDIQTNSRLVALSVYKHFHHGGPSPNCMLEILLCHSHNIQMVYYWDYPIVQNSEAPVKYGAQIYKC